MKRLNRKSAMPSPIKKIDASNYLYADGHAEWMNWRDFRNKMFMLNPDSSTATYQNTGLW